MTRRDQARMWQAKADEAARQLRHETDPGRRDLLEVAAVRWARQAAAAGRLPESQRWAIGAGAFCGGLSALFLLPSALAGWANVAPQMLVGGVGGPAVVAVLAWQVKQLAEYLDGRRPGQDSQLGEAMVEAAERAHAARARAVTR